MKKKILCTMMSMVMVASLFAGCGTDSGTENSASDNSKTEETGQTTSDDPYAAYAGTTISVAAIETGYGSQMWQEVTDAFTEETGIQVELTTDKKLEDVIGPSMQGGEYPDVIHLATGREAALTEQFIKGNMITDITDVLSMKVPGEDKLVSEKIAGGFTDTSLTNPYGDGKTYLAPMFYSPCGLFYNAGLLEEKGWDVPTTWDEMWELGDKAKEEGIYLFTYPTTGYFDAFFYALMYAAGGPEFFDKATNYEEGIWETPEAQTCFDIVAKLAEYTNPITPAQANDQDFTQNQQLVLDNKAIFMPNGTWIVGEMADAPRADGFKWGMTALPAVKAGGDSYSYTWFEQAWIPAGAEHLDAAKQFSKKHFSGRNVCNCSHSLSIVVVSFYNTSFNLKFLCFLCKVSNDSCRSSRISFGDSDCRRSFEMLRQRLELGSFDCKVQHGVFVNLVNDAFFSHLFTKLCILLNGQTAVVNQNNASCTFQICRDLVYNRFFQFNFCHEWFPPYRFLKEITFPVVRIKKPSVPQTQRVHKSFLIECFPRQAYQPYALRHLLSSGSHLQLL